MDLHIIAFVGLLGGFELQEEFSVVVLVEDSLQFYLLHNHRGMYCKRYGEFTLINHKLLNKVNRSRF